MLLNQIRDYFGAGTVTSTTDARLRFEYIKELEAVINHFNKYPLITKKFEDYKLFKQDFYLVKNKKHLTEKGLK